MTERDYPPAAPWVRTNNPIEGMARRHEQTAAAIPPETYIRTTLGQIDPANERAGRIEDHHAVVSRAAAPAAPQIAVNVDAQAVGYAAFRRQ